MSDRRMKTIPLQGKKYTPVKERVKAFHDDNSNGSIETNWFTAFEGQNNTMISFKAIVRPDTKNPDSFFTGHALGKISNEKAFEKLETVAVGRALALAGYLSNGDIASADEMERFLENQDQSVTYPKRLVSLINRYPFDKSLKNARNGKPYLNDGSKELDLVEKDISMAVVSPEDLHYFYTFNETMLEYLKAIPQQQLEVDLMVID